MHLNTVPTDPPQVSVSNLDETGTNHWCSARADTMIQHKNGSWNTKDFVGMIKVVAAQR